MEKKLKKPSEEPNGQSEEEIKTQTYKNQKRPRARGGERGSVAGQPHFRPSGSKARAEVRSRSHSCRPCDRPFGREGQPELLSFFLNYAFWRMPAAAISVSLPAGSLPGAPRLAPRAASEKRHRRRSRALKSATCWGGRNDRCAPAASRIKSCRRSATGASVVQVRGFARQQKNTHGNSTKIKDGGWVPLKKDQILFSFWEIAELRLSADNALSPSRRVVHVSRC